jgi:hypothetical protein
VHRHLEFSRFFEFSRLATFYLFFPAQKRKDENIVDICDISIENGDIVTEICLQK